jgi:hypothetical protein
MESLTKSFLVKLFVDLFLDQRLNLPTPIQIRPTEMIHRSAKSFFVKVFGAPLNAKLYKKVFSETVCRYVFLISD